MSFLIEEEKARKEEEEKLKVESQEKYEEDYEEDEEEEKKDEVKEPEKTKEEPDAIIKTDPEPPTDKVKQIEKSATDDPIKKFSIATNSENYQEPTKPEPVKEEPTKPEPIIQEPVKQEPVKEEPIKQGYSLENVLNNKLVLKFCL